MDSGLIINTGLIAWIGFPAWIINCRIGRCRRFFSKLPSQDSQLTGTIMFRQIFPVCMGNPGLVVTQYEGVQLIELLSVRFMAGAVETGTRSRPFTKCAGDNAFIPKPVPNEVVRLVSRSGPFLC